MVHISYDEDDFKWSIVANFERKKAPGTEP